MANPQQELDKIKAQIEGLKQQLGGKDGIDVVNIKDLATARTILRGLNDEANDLAMSFGDMATTLSNIVSELSKSDSATKSATKAYRGLVSVAQKMQYEEEGIYSYNVKQLDNLHKQAKSQLVNLKTAIDRSKAEGDTSEQAYALAEAYNTQLKLETSLSAAIFRRLNLEKKVEKTFGATGALIEGSSKLLSTMGFGHLSSELSELNDKLKSDLRDELKKSGDEVNKIALGFKYMGKGLAGSAKIFANGLADPLFIVGKIFDTYLDINKASVELSHLTGQNAVKFKNIGLNAASLKDSLETMAELTKKTGMNAQNIFSSKVIGQAAALKTTMGLTADEAGGLAIMSQTTGKNVDDIVESVVATTSAFNGANRAAVSQGTILKEVANTSDSIKLSLGNNDVALTKAASAATRLGLSLQEVDNIASSLTDFQSSISNELEAELLIGKDLNLEKARELALSNDLEGVANELFKNSSDIAEFGKMNRIQQEAYAKSLGMTKDQLAKIAYQKALEKGMTEEQAAAAAKVEAKDMKRIAMQENFAKALEKIAGAIAPILDLVGDLLSIPLAPYLLLGFAAVAKIGGGLVGTVKSMGSLAKGTLDFVKNLNMKGISEFFGGLKDKFGALKSAFGEGLAGKVQEKVADTGGSITEKLADKAKDKTESIVEDKVGGLGDKVAQASEKTKNVKAGTGVKDFLTNLGKGLASLGKSLANGQVLLGLGALTLSLIGIGYALKLAAPGIEAFGKVISAIFTGLAEIITAVADGFVKLMGAVTMENIGPMLLLGPALFGIAAGLGALSIAGLLALPAIGGLVLLSKAAPALVSLGIGGGESKSAGEAKGKGEEGSLAVVAAKLDALIAVAKQGTKIYIGERELMDVITKNSTKYASKAY